MLYRNLLLRYSSLAALLFLSCSIDSGTPNPRLTMFVGVDISGSFIQGEHFEESLDFLAHYIFAHMNGLGDLERPRELFVGSIGGANTNEPKTFYPRHTFEGKSIDMIREKLKEIFPQSEVNPFTDYNAFFQQVAHTVRNRNLVLRPISIVTISDGRPDVKRDGETDFASLELKPLENLSRNITIRLLYTDAVVGMNWQTQVKRQRVKIWTQDAEVMTTWRDPQIFQPEVPFEEQERLFAWIKDNVNFGVRSQRVD